jgi:hypothetical protein
MHNTHPAEHRQDVLDLLGLDLVRGQQRVDLVAGDVAAFLGAADQLLDGGVRKVEQRTVGRDLWTPSFGNSSVCGVALVLLAMSLSTVRAGRYPAA